MKQPPGFVNPNCPTHVCKVVKSLYGLKQALRAWNAKFTSYLVVVGFKAYLSDSSLFVKQVGTDMIILLLYVNDVILIGSNIVLIQFVIDNQGIMFDLKDMGPLTYFLGL